MSKLTMNREGSFHVKATGDNHCGVDEDLDIRYKLVCECAPSLDYRGFLFDQLHVADYFKTVRRSRLSCERLVIKCCQDLKKMILKENPHCEILKMELTFSPAPHAATMTFSL